MITVPTKAEAIQLAKRFTLPTPPREIIKNATRVKMALASGAKTYKDVARSLGITRNHAHMLLTRLVFTGHIRITHKGRKGFSKDPTHYALPLDRSPGRGSTERCDYCQKEFGLQEVQLHNGRLLCPVCRQIVAPTFDRQPIHQNHS